MLKKTFFIETYGCQMNIAESNALEARLLGNGLAKADEAEHADVVILNTCSVRKTAESRIWGRLGFFAHVKKSHPLTLVVTGCMAQRLLDELQKEAPQVDYVVGVNDKQKILDIATDGSFTQSDTYEFDHLSYHEGDVSSFVPIMNGCNNCCTYCIVPYVRGRETSRPVADILREIDFLEGKGVREVTLLGQNVNSYHSTEEEGRIVLFPELLRRIAERCHTIRWVRFDSPHPKDFSDDLIKVLATEKHVAKHVHVPLQSGSTRVLGLMNRHYTKEQFVTLLDKMRGQVPGITFAVDVMVGFPGETEEEFHDTLEVMGNMKAIEPFMYYYNPREGTRATKMKGQIDDDTKHRRLSELIAFETEIVRKEHEKRIGQETEVLLTQISKQDGNEMLGHTEHDEMVVVKTCAPVGSLLNVKLTGIKGNTFEGTLVGEEKVDG